MKDVRRRNPRGFNPGGLWSGVQSPDRPTYREVDQDLFDFLGYFLLVLVDLELPATIRRRTGSDDRDRYLYMVTVCPPHGVAHGEHTVWCRHL